MTTPKQDLTAEQIENFRSYCHAYLEKIGPTHALIDRVCDLALKGIEAEARRKELYKEVERGLYGEYAHTLTPQKSEPSGLHPSHKTRIGDASSWDEVCVKCGAADIAGGGWGKLKEPCPNEHSPWEPWAVPPKRPPVEPSPSGSVEGRLNEAVQRFEKCRDDRPLVVRRICLTSSRPIWSGPVQTLSAETCDSCLWYR